jgi:hypothetical protein
MKTFKEWRESQEDICPECGKLGGEYTPILNACSFCDKCRKCGHKPKVIGINGQGNEEWSDCGCGHKPGHRNGQHISQFI